MDEEKAQIEPLFNYLRIGSDLKEVLKNDSISSACATSKVLFIGTSWGQLYTLDHEGNINSSQKFPKHIVAINKISVDNKGEYAASCSDDGKVKHNIIIKSQLLYL